MHHKICKNIPSKLWNHHALHIISHICMMIKRKKRHVIYAPDFSFLSHRFPDSEQAKRASHWIPRYLIGMCVFVCVRVKNSMDSSLLFHYYYFSFLIVKWKPICQSLLTFFLGLFSSFSWYLCIFYKAY